MSNLARVLECIVSPSPRMNEPVDRPTIKVLLDGRKIEDGGIGVYIRNLIAGLTGLPFIKLTVLVHPGKGVVAEQAGAHGFIEDTAKLYSLDELFFLRNRIPFKDFDVFHVPHYTLPYRIPIPTVVTIHDTIHISHGEKFYFPFIARRLIKSAMRRASKIITVSEATKRCLSKLSRRAEKKVEVVPNAVDPIFMIETCLAESTLEDVRGDYGIAVFSNTKRHKGFEDLVAAFRGVTEYASKLPDDDRIKKRLEKLKLVLVGTGTEPYKGKDLGAGIYVAGAVATRDLQKLYSNAQFLIVSSLIEGFCLPVIEAQACATPVIARPAPAVLELMTTNDLVCKDLSVGAMTDAIVEFFRKRIEKPELVDYGVPLNHMQRFCREDVSRSVAEVYQEVINAR